MALRSSAAPTAHRFTRDEYYRMAKAGLFQDERVELLDGEIITMSAQLSLHAFTVSQLMYELIAKLGSAAIVRGQAPIVLNNRSEPEPDIAVCVSGCGSRKKDIKIRQGVARQSGPLPISG